MSFCVLLNRVGFLTCTFFAGMTFSHHCSRLCKCNITELNSAVYRKSFSLFLLVLTVECQCKMVSVGGTFFLFFQCWKIKKMTLPFRTFYISLFCGAHHAYLHTQKPADKHTYLLSLPLLGCDPCQDTCVLHLQIQTKQNKMFCSTFCCILKKWLKKKTQ